MVNCSTDFVSSNHVLATCRTSLKKQGVVGLNMAPCMRAFLEGLPTMLQEQYTYEKVGVTYFFVIRSNGLFSIPVSYNMMHEDSILQEK